MAKSVMKLLASTMLALFPLGVHAEFIGLGDLAGGWWDADGPFYSVANGVSADGSVVVGLSKSASGLEAFRWTTGGGMAGLGALPGSPFVSTALGVSADGSVVVGHAGSGSGIEAFRWTLDGGMVGLGDLPGGMIFSEAYAVSADGGVVVGDGTGTSGIEAFRWTSGGGMVGLGDLPGGALASHAYGISADGTVVVGYGTGASGIEAFRWTLGDGMMGLGDLPGGKFASRAYDVSADGSVVVGIGTGASGTEAFRWTSGGGMVGLGSLHSGVWFYSAAHGVSADGSVVVGYTSSPAGQEAFRWTSDRGMQRVSDWLADNGITHGWGILQRAHGVSDDGNSIVGNGFNASGDTEAFLAKVVPAPSAPTETPAPDKEVPDPSTPTQAGGIIGLTDFTRSVQDVSVAGQLAGKGNQFMATNLGRFSLSPGKRPSAVTPFAGHISGSKVYSAGLMAGHAFTCGVAVQGSVSRMRGNDVTRYNGKTGIEGTQAGLAVQLKVGTLFRNAALDPLALTFGHMVGRFDGDIERRYRNGANVETAEGDTDIDTRSTFVKADWTWTMSDRWSVSPHAQLTYVRNEVEDYTETGGAFAGTVSKQVYNGVERTFGLCSRWQAKPFLRLYTDASVTSLSNDQGDGVTVTVPGAGVYGFAGTEYKRTYMTLAGGACWALQEDLNLNLDASVTNCDGYAEDWSLGLGLTYRF